MIQSLRVTAAAFALGACATEAPPPPLATPTTEPSAPVGEAGAAEWTWPFLAAVNPSCLEPLGRASASPTETTIADAVKAPQAVEYESKAFVVFRGACHFGAKMRGNECRPFVVLSDTRYAGVKAAMSPTVDLVLFVDDSSKWEQFSEHKVRYGLCSFEAGALAAQVIGQPAKR